MGPEIVPGRMALLVTLLLTLVNISGAEKAKGPKSKSFKAIDVWIFSCIVFVIAALVEYAVLIKIRYGNASARLVKARLMLMAKKQPATEGEVTPQTTAKFQESAAAAIQQEERTAVAVSMCRTIDSWALAIFTL